MRTEAQRRASRENGAKSRGPTSPEGKDVSKFNGVTHGLCAVHVTLPGEDPAAFEAERGAWFGDWRPCSFTRAVLVERAAVSSWRLRRAVRAEADVLRARGEEAGRQFDNERELRVRRAVDRFDDDPRAAITLLWCSRDGVDRLIKSWRSLSKALRGGPRGWDRVEYGQRLRILTGHFTDAPAPEVGPHATASSRLLAVNDPGRKARPLDPGEGEALVAELRTLVAANLRTLRTRRRETPDPAVERQSAIDTATADAYSSKEAQLRHRYEMDHDRVFRATLRHLAALDRSGADLGASQAVPEVAVETVAQPDAKSPVAPAEVPAAPAPPPTAPGSVRKGDFGSIPGRVIVLDRPPTAPPRAPRRPGRRRSPR